MSAPARFAAGTTYLHENRIAVLSTASASASNPCPPCQPKPLGNGNYVLNQPTCNVFQAKKECWRLSQHQKKTSYTDRNEQYFFATRVSQVNVKTMIRILSKSLNCWLLNVW